LIGDGFVGRQIALQKPTMELLDLSMFNPIQFISTILQEKQNYQELQF